MCMLRNNVGNDTLQNRILKDVWIAIPDNNTYVDDDAIDDYKLMNDKVVHQYYLITAFYIIYTQKWIDDDDFKWAQNQ